MSAAEIPRRRRLAHPRFRIQLLLGLPRQLLDHMPRAFREYTIPRHMRLTPAPLAHTHCCRRRCLLLLFVVVVLIFYLRGVLLQAVGPEDGLAGGALDKLCKLRRHAHGVQPRIVAARVLIKEARDDGGFAALVGEIEQVLHFLVEHDFFREGVAVRGRRAEEGLLFWGEDEVWIDGGPEVRGDGWGGLLVFSSRAHKIE